MARTKQFARKRLIFPPRILRYPEDVVVYDHPRPIGTMSSDTHEERGSKPARIRIAGQQVFLLDETESQRTLPQDVVERSHLLLNLRESEGETGLPVSEQQLISWHQFVSDSLEAAKPGPTGGAPRGRTWTDRQTLLRVLKVAEFLLDAETASMTASDLARRLIVNASVGTNENEILRDLHPDLQLKIIKAANCKLSHSQPRLVQDLKPLALQALITEGDEKLDLSEEALSPALCPPEGLSSMTSLKHLNLAHSDAAGAGDPAVFAASLSTLTNLSHLDLHSNMIQSAACEHLAAALKSLTLLQYLDVAGNVLQLQGLDQLAPGIVCLQELTYLSLAENSIVSGTATLKPILAALPKLHTLKLSHNAILRPPPAAASAGAAPGTARPPTDQQPETYLLMPALACLMISNNCLDSRDADLRIRPLLTACPCLTELDLSDNSLATKAVPVLRDMLSQCSALRSLDVSNCSFSCPEIAEMLAALPRQAPAAAPQLPHDAGYDEWVPLLEVLSLSEMEGSPAEGDEDIEALPTALKAFKHLQRLDISSLDLPGGAIDALPVTSLTALTSLDVSMNCMLQQSAFGTQIAALTALQCLNVHSLFLPDDVLFSFAGSLSSLTVLSVLDLGNNAITEGRACLALCRSLASLPALQSLNLEDNDLLLAESSFVAALPRMTGLRELSLAQNELHEESVEPLALALSQLTLLSDVTLTSVCGSDTAALRLASSLSALTDLTSLVLANNPWHSKDPKALGEMLAPLTRLSHLDIASMDFHVRHLPRITEDIARASTLTSLDLSHNDIGLEGAKAIAPELRSMTWLRELDLSSTMVTPDGLRLVAGSLAAMTALRVVRLDYVVGRGSAPEAWGAVFAALAGIPGLRELWLRHNKFPSACIEKFIAPHMAKLTALESLDFQECSMSSEGVRQMLLAMRPLTALHSLNLGGNKIKDSVEHIVKHHPLLEELDLPRAELKDDSVRALMRSLHVMPMLRLVTLSDNAISEDTIQAMAEELPHVLVVFEDDIAEMDDVLSVDEGQDGVAGADDDDDDDDDDDEDDDDDDDASEEDEEDDDEDDGSRYLMSTASPRVAVVRDWDGEGSDEDTAEEDTDDYTSEDEPDTPTFR